LVIGYLISRQACRPAFSNSYFETLSLPALARCYLAALPSMSLIPFAPFYFLIYFVSHHFPATAHFRHHDFFDNDRFACRAVVGRRRVLKRFLNRTIACSRNSGSPGTVDACFTS